MRRQKLVREKEAIRPLRVRLSLNVELTEKSQVLMETTVNTDSVPGTLARLKEMMEIFERPVSEEGKEVVQAEDEGPMTAEGTNSDD